MAGSVFEDWVRKLNRKYLLKGRSIALVIDNCPEHPALVIDNCPEHLALVIDNCPEHPAIEGLKAITLVFLPPNTTSVLQPCDQGIIQALKMHYGKRVLKKVIAAIETEKTPDSVIKEMNVLDAMTTAASVWDDVSHQTIANCFRHVGFKTNLQAAEPANSELSELQVDHSKEHDEIKKMSKFSETSQEGSTTVKDYVNVDTGLKTSAPLTDKKIVASVQPTGSGNASDDEEEADEATCVPNILPTSAVQAVACLRNFVLQQQNSQDMLQHITSLENVVEDIATSSRRQSTITEFFTLN